MDAKRWRGVTRRFSTVSPRLGEVPQTFAMKPQSNPTRLARLILTASLLLGAGIAAAQTPQFPNPVTINPDQTITLTPNPNGDRIPDFSTVGFNYGNSPLPGEPGGYDVPVLVTLQPGVGDQTDRIQAAIDWIATRPLINGFRGALLLKAGRWEIHSVNRLRVSASGVVDHPLTGTRLYALATTNEANSGNTRNSRLIAFDGGGLTASPTRTLVDNVYIPGGTNVIPITGHTFTVGQRLQVRWPGRRPATTTPPPPPTAIPPSPSTAS